MFHFIQTNSYNSREGNRFLEKKRYFSEKKMYFPAKFKDSIVIYFDKFGLSQNVSGTQKGIFKLNSRLLIFFRTNLVPERQHASVKDRLLKGKKIQN
jgi:hypothetical protein